MEEYIELVEMLKVYTNNTQILHRHLIGANWYGNHEQLGKYYEHMQEDIDNLVEIGLSIEIEEPTMLESFKYYKELEIKNRDSKESYTILKEYFDNIIAQINRIDNIPADVINKLQEKQEYYRLESNYKLFRTIK